MEMVVKFPVCPSPKEKQNVLQVGQYELFKRDFFGNFGQTHGKCYNEIFAVLKETNHDGIQKVFIDGNIKFASLIAFGNQATAVINKAMSNFGIVELHSDVLKVTFNARYQLNSVAWSQRKRGPSSNVQWFTGKTANITWSKERKVL